MVYVIPNLYFFTDKYLSSKNNFLKIYMLAKIMDIQYIRRYILTYIGRQTAATDHCWPQQHCRRWEGKGQRLLIYFIDIHLEMKYNCTMYWSKASTIRRFQFASTTFVLILYNFFLSVLDTMITLHFNQKKYWLESFVNAFNMK